MHQSDGLRVAQLVNEEGIGFFVLRHPFGQGHSFGRRSTFVQQGSGGQIQTGQVHGQLLEVQNGFQATLGNFRLIRRIGGIPTRVFQDVAQNDIRRQRRVITHADVRFADLVFSRHGFEHGQGFFFAFGCTDGQIVVEADTARHGFFNQRINRLSPNRRQHGSRFIGIRADVAIDKSVFVFQFGQTTASIRHGHLGW